MDDRIKVLDRGYVRLFDTLGSDLAVVNAARASFAKESDSLTDSDRKLIGFLSRHGHMSPFRHCVLSFEIKAPLMVARQWWRYHVGSSHTEAQDGWNEASRRYVTGEPEFYVPGIREWRSAPENKKQGSGDALPREQGVGATQTLQNLIGIARAYYERALEEGICAEQARLFLPAYALYVTWRWTVSLEGVAHLLTQRLADDAQWEFREYAATVRQLAEPLFPVSLAALRGELP